MKKAYISFLLLLTLLIGLGVWALVAGVSEHNSKPRLTEYVLPDGRQSQT
ncbi:MAG: hypothetical protein FWF69_10605 [Firmicutes bacterium]|nr:hypothetical protein [Bacillota bacterium]